MGIPITRNLSPATLCRLQVRMTPPTNTDKKTVGAILQTFKTNSPTKQASCPPVPLDTFPPEQRMRQLYHPRALPDSRPWMRDERKTTIQGKIGHSNLHILSFSRYVSTTPTTFPASATSLKSTHKKHPYDSTNHNSHIYNTNWTHANADIAQTKQYA